jgi:hypothetical protein
MLELMLRHDVHRLPRRLHWVLWLYYAAGSLIAYSLGNPSSSSLYSPHPHRDGSGHDPEYRAAKQSSE